MAGIVENRDSCWRISSAGTLQPILRGFSDSIFGGALPSFLYRYRPITENLLERLEQEIVRGEVWLSSLSRLNDPDEGAIDVRLLGSKDRLGEFFARSGSLAMEEIESRVSNLQQSDGVVPPGVEAGLIATVRERTHVACFSATAVEPLMWAHYGVRAVDRMPHAGICIEYAIDESARWTGLQPVGYTESRPRLNYLVAHNDPSEIRRALVTKSSSWRYEQEWRVIAFDQAQPGAMGAKLLAAPAGRIASVILGLNVTQHVTAVLSHIVSTMSSPPALKRIVRRRSTYNLDVVDA